MLAAIHFNDKLCVETDEIKDTASKWSLAAKLEPCQSAMPQQPPHSKLCVGSVAPQGSRETAGPFANRPMMKSWRH
jgi:hypothetical protein